jgi:hypothetical protein
VTKKLKLLEFLAGCDNTPVKVSSVRKEETGVLSYPLSEFCTTVSTYNGTFCINDRLYGSVIPSTNSLYFFNEDNTDEYMIIFDPIIDIKKRDNGFNIFYYPDHVINIILKESYVKEESVTEKNTEGEHI